MARIAGINIPQNKVVSIALTYIHGIGLYSSKKICKKLNISETTRVNQLSEDQVLKISEITNTVYYYPLTTAIKKFLKTPTVKIGENLDHFQIVKKGIEDFNTTYGNTIYENGTIAKVAIYCSSIEMLENEIYPYFF